MPGKTSDVRMEASGRPPLYFKRNSVTFIIEWVLVKVVVPATYTDHHCRNWHLWCTLLSSSSSHRFLVNTDFSFLYMWKVQRNIAWYQKHPLPPLPAHTHARSNKFWIKAVLWDLDFLTMRMGGCYSCHHRRPCCRRAGTGLGLVDLRSSTQDETQCWLQKVS